MSAGGPVILRRVPTLVMAAAKDGAPTFAFAAQHRSKIGHGFKLNGKVDKLDPTERLKIPEWLIDFVAAAGDQLSAVTGAHGFEHHTESWINLNANDDKLYDDKGHMLPIADLKAGS